MWFGNFFGQLFGKKFLIGSAIFYSLSSCVTHPPIMNQTSLNEVDFSNVAKFKRGESCTTFLLGLIPFGSSRITAAARDGKLKKIYVLEYENRNYILVTQSCLMVYGA